MLYVDETVTETVHRNIASGSLDSFNILLKLLFFLLFLLSCCCFFLLIFFLDLLIWKNQFNANDLQIRCIDHSVTTGPPINKQKVWTSIQRYLLIFFQKSLAYIRLFGSPYLEMLGILNFESGY